jgi:Fur family zinc uptake transcriptional regulator
MSVRETCAEQGLRLTTLREAALVIIATSDRPLGAYHLLSLLQQRLGKRIGPPTVYRALDFLLTAKLITRVETRNAYVLSRYPEQTSVLFVCDRCDASMSINDVTLEQLIAADAAALGFHISKPIVECTGTCRSCARAGDDETITAVSPSSRTRTG